MKASIKFLTIMGLVACLNSQSLASDPAPTEQPETARSLPRLSPEKRKELEAKAATMEARSKLGVLAILGASPLLVGGVLQSVLSGVDKITGVKVNKLRTALGLVALAGGSALVYFGAPGVEHNQELSDINEILDDEKALEALEKKYKVADAKREVETPCLPVETIKSDSSAVVE